MARMSNPPYPTADKALKRAEEQKTVYDVNLADKEVLYTYIEKQVITYEVAKFSKENYLHLTGLDYQNRQSIKRTTNPNISTNSLEFYRRLGTDATLISDISFIQELTSDKTDITFNNTQRKLENLSKLTQMSKMSEKIGDYQGSGGYSIAIGRKNESLLFVRHPSTSILIPTSSQKGDIRRITNNTNNILAIFVKDDVSFPFHLTYLNQKENVHNYLMDAKLRSLISLTSFVATDNTKFNQEQLQSLRNSYIASVLKELEQLRMHICEDGQQVLSQYESYYNDFIKDLKQNGNIDDCEKTLNLLKSQKSKLEKAAMDSTEKELIMDELKGEFETDNKIWNDQNAKLEAQRTIKFVWSSPLNANPRNQTNQSAVVSNPDFLLQVKLPLPVYKLVQTIRNTAKSIGFKIQSWVSAITDFIKKKDIKSDDDSGGDGGGAGHFSVPVVDNTPSISEEDKLKEVIPELGMTREEMRQELQAFYDAQDNKPESVLSPEPKAMEEDTNNMEEKPKIINQKAEDDYER